jgi:hypothetical protein
LSRYPSPRRTTPIGPHPPGTGVDAGEESGEVDREVHREVSEIRDGAVHPPDVAFECRGHHRRDSSLVARVDALNACDRRQRQQRQGKESPPPHQASA